jgi:ribosomal-protein-alanine N-acetyltransferase
VIRPIREVPVEIRTMIYDDVAQVADIERRSYEFPWSHGVFRDCLLAGYNCIVIEREGRIAGYSILSIAAGEAHILNLCVDTKYRQLGYGQQLLEEILERAEHDEVSEIFLEVRPSNKKAIALYNKKGFRHVANRPAYYQAREGREDAAVLSKRLRKR